MPATLPQTSSLIFHAAGCPYRSLILINQNAIHYTVIAREGISDTGFGSVIHPVKDLEVHAIHADHGGTWYTIFHDVYLYWNQRPK